MVQMASQFSDNTTETICKFDDHFLKLLEVDGGFVKRMKYGKFVKKAKEFYHAYVKKCNEYNTYMDFFTPLLWYLVGCGYGYDQSAAYLSEIRGGIIEHLRKTLPAEILNNLGDNFGQSS